jgi:hypothetical protein
LAGRASSISRSASVPPVEAPTQTTFGGSWPWRVPWGEGSTASAVSFSDVVHQTALRRLRLFTTQVAEPRAGGGLDDMADVVAGLGQMVGRPRSWA